MPGTSVGEDIISEASTFVGKFYYRHLAPCKKADGRSPRPRTSANIHERTIRQVQSSWRYGIYHHLPDRVRAHVFLCMLAYYVEWHMRQRLVSILFDDDDRAGREALRESIVSPAQRSLRAMKKTMTKRTESGMPVHSFQTLLEDLAIIAKDHVEPKLTGAIPFYKITWPTPVQKKALDLLGVKLHCTQWDFYTWGHMDG